MVSLRALLPGAANTNETTGDCISQNAKGTLVHKRPSVGQERVNRKSRPAVNLAALLGELVALGLCGSTLSFLFSWKN